MFSAGYCGNFEFITFLRRFLERVFAGSIVNIRNEWVFSGFMKNESESGANKSPENVFPIHGICLSRTQIHSNEPRKDRHSFLNNSHIYLTSVYIL